MKLDILAHFNSKGPMSVSASLAELGLRNKERQKAIGALGTPLARASIWLDRWVQLNFRSEGGNVGGWEPFALGGRVTKDGIDASAKLLQDTGRLRSSFLPFHTKNNAGVISDLFYAGYHQRGEGVPERRMLPKRAEVIDDIRRIMQSHVDDAVK